MPSTRTADGTVPQGWPVEVVDEVVAVRVRKLLWPAWIAAGACVLGLGVLIWALVEQAGTREAVQDCARQLAARR